MPAIDGIDALRTLAGQDLGAGEWVTVTQERINAFADTTGDHTPCGHRRGDHGADHDGARQ